MNDEAWPIIVATTKEDIRSVAAFYPRTNRNRSETFRRVCASNSYANSSIKRIEIINNGNNLIDSIWRTYWSEYWGFLGRDRLLLDTF